MWIKWTGIVKTGNYQFSKSRGCCCRCKKLKRLNTRPRTVNVVSSFPLGWLCNTAWEIARKCGMHIYSQRTLGLLHGKRLWVFLQKYLSRTWGTKFFKLVILVGERGQRLKLGPCKSKVKKFSVPLWQTANMLLRLLYCIHKR